MLHHTWFGDTTASALPIVLLHEGLGSVSSWGSFPQLLADRLQRPVLAYDRRGYGQSPAHPGPWPADFMHQEARLLADFLTAQGLTEVILFGHSDGASISLLYAAVNQDRTAPRIAAIISASAHTFLEDVSVTSIQRLRASFNDGLRKPLSRHHNDVDATFGAWSGVWVSDRFSTWAIDDELGAIDCPVLAIQGSIDSYGSWAQVDRLVAGVGSEVEVLKLDDVDHWPHREATEEVLSAVAEFLAANDG